MGESAFQVGVGVLVKVIVEVAVNGANVGVGVKVWHAIAVFVGEGKVGWTGPLSSMGRPQWVKTRAHRAIRGKKAPKRLKTMNGLLSSVSREESRSRAVISPVVSFWRFLAGRERSIP